MSLVKTKTLIVVKAQFDGLHSWKDCPHDDVGFLRHPHRHIFHVTLKIQVYHANRDLEFFQMKRRLESFLKGYEYDLGSSSCEMLAEQIAGHFSNYPVEMVSVFEDNENGAEVHFVKQF